MKIQEANCFCCCHDAILNPRALELIMARHSSLGLSARSRRICMALHCCLQPSLHQSWHPSLEGPLSKHQTQGDLDSSGCCPQTCPHLRGTPRFACPHCPSQALPCLPESQPLLLPGLPASNPKLSHPSSPKRLLKSDPATHSPSSPN